MLSHLKRRVALLSIVMLSATVLAVVPASPAYAAVKTPLANAQYSACPTAASIPSAGFTDTTSTDVDCIAYYGITTGTTATTYSPTDSVTRWQMALYLTRAAGPAGVTLGAGTDDGTFTDISGKSDEIKTAIMQIKDLGISIGKTATTFAPDDAVNREEMALFINRFLAVTTAGPGGVNDLLVDDDNLRASGVGTPITTTNYTDIATGTTYEGRNAITKLWHMGITDDASSTSTTYSTIYAPGTSMTRAAMATFMAKALDHTNARPKGVTLQSAAWASDGHTAISNVGAGAPTLSASHRDDSFVGAAGTVIDVFYWVNSTTEGYADFTSTGLCSTATGGPAAASNSYNKCLIDTSDQATDANGNIVPTVASQAAGKTADYYAWTAATATGYDNDLHAADASKLTIAKSYSATNIGLTCDVSATASTTASDTTVPFGKDITCTAQTTLSTGGANNYTHTAIAEAGIYVSWTHTRTVTTSPNDTVTPDGSVTIQSTTIGTTSATGTATFTIPAANEIELLTGSATTTDVVDDGLSVRAYRIVSGSQAYVGLHDSNTYNLTTIAGDWGTCVSNPTPTQLGTHTTCTLSLTFVDTADVFTSGALALTSRYGKEAAAGVSRTATFTGFDQYGDAFAGTSVQFSSTVTLPTAATIQNAGDTFTTSVPHGLAVGDDLIVSSLAAGCLIVTDSDTIHTLLASAPVTVSLATTTTTFQLTSDNHGGGVVQSITATCEADDAGVGLTGSTFGTTSAITTGTAGTASYAFSDTESTGAGGSDTISAVAGSVTKTKAYYRTQNVYNVADVTTFSDGTSTAAVWNEVIAGSASAAGDALTDRTTANDIMGGIVYLDAANDRFVVQITEGEETGETPITRYLQYQYDDNDQFCYNKLAGDSTATCQTATTMATWESQLSNAPAILLGATAFSSTDDYTTYEKAGGGPVTVNYAALSTGISVFHIG